MLVESCLCGCGLNAASSSRIPPNTRASTRFSTRSPRRSLHNTVLASLPTPTLDSRVSHIDRVIPPMISSADLFDSAAQRQSTKRRPGQRNANLLPLMLMLLYAFVTTAVASSIPAATPARVSTDLAAASNASIAALPTTSPAQSGTAFKQLGAAASGAPASSNVDIQVSQPIMCQPMNVTFDPSSGKPPYTVMISIEDYFPVTVSLPASYDDASKDLWLYQYDVPTFTGSTKNPSLIVSVTDSTGLLSNSSNFVQVQAPAAGVTCSPFQYSASYYFYTVGAASMCQDYEIVWNGSYAPPMTAVFLPEAAPPIWVPAAQGAINMTWQVAMEGGTPFVMSLADSRQINGNGGVSKLNIVALNEYFSNSCISQTNYQHRVFAPTSTAATASIFPDATSMVATLTTSGGVVATVTVIETIKNGRLVHNNRGGLSGASFLILMVALFVGIALIGAAAGWFCFRRHQKHRQNIRAWDLPDNDPSVPFSANPNMPIAPGVFGRGVTRQGSTVTNAQEERGAGASGVDSYDPVSLSSRPLTHALSTRASLRSWTSSLHLATGTQTGHHQPGDDYPMIDTVSGVDGHHTRNLTLGTLSNGSRDALSPTDSISRTFGFYSDDRQTPDNASVKSTRVGPGPTYRPDAAYQAAYQDLLASQTPPASGVDGSLPFSASRSQAPSSRGNGWAEVSDGTAHSGRIVRHADAGLLLDDNDDGDELVDLGTGRLMELPPEYDTIHPSTRSPQRSNTHGQTGSRLEDPFASPPIHPQRSHTHGLASVDISDTRNRPAEVHAADLVDENDDESAFWAH